MHGNQQTFKSTFGALISIGSKLGILIYFIMLVKTVVKKEQATLTAYEYFNNLFLEPQEYVVNQNEFDVAVQLTYQGTNQEVKDNLDTYFSVSFRHVYMNYKPPTETDYGSGTGDSGTQYGGFLYVPTIFPTVKCSENRFGNDTVGKGPNMTYFWCAEKLENIHVVGTLASTLNKFFQVSVNPCDQSLLDK